MSPIAHGIDLPYDLATLRDKKTFTTTRPTSIIRIITAKIIASVEPTLKLPKIAVKMQTPNTGQNQYVDQQILNKIYKL